MLGCVLRSSSMPISTLRIFWESCRRADWLSSISPTAPVVHVDQQLSDQIPRDPEFAERLRKQSPSPFPDYAVLIPHDFLRVVLVSSSVESGLSILSIEESLEFLECSISGCSSSVDVLHSFTNG